MRESIEPREKEVKKEALMGSIKVIEVNDLESQSGSKRGERPVGVPAAHGHWGYGGADIRGTLESPEHDLVCRSWATESIGRSAQFSPVRKYSKVGSWELRCMRHGKAKDLTPSAQRQGGEKSEKDRRDPSTCLKQWRRPQDCDAHRIVRDAEFAEKTLRFAGGGILGRVAPRGAGIEWGGGRW
jgi:hypothetical protein